MFRPDRRREHAAGPNALAAAREEIVARGGRVLDLSAGDPGASGLGFPAEDLRAAADEAFSRAATYLPDPQGRIEARESIADDYARRGRRVAPDRLLVTPGTSVSYLFAFSVLARPGDEILVPRPSYPLFEEIARVAGVRLVPYWLRESDSWRIDADYLESQVSTRTRAVVLVSPHNPTGSVATPAEVAALAAIARRHDLAILADEVFDGFVFGPDAPGRAADTDALLLLTLDGLSKRLWLSGWKIGWIAVSGDEERAAEATWMLAHVADGFLPVNEWAQCAVPGILARAGDTTRRLRAHAQRGRERVLEALAIPDVTGIIPPAGGLSATVRLVRDDLREEDVALALLRERRILVHPGHFYDMPPDHLVLTCAAREEILDPALRAIAGVLAAGGSGPR